MKLVEYNISLDLKERVINDYIELVHQDNQSVQFNISITENKAPYSLEGLEVLVTFRKADGTQSTQSNVNVDNNLISIIVNNESIDSSGKVDCEVVIKDGTTVLTSQKFNFEVREGLTIKSVGDKDDVVYVLEILEDIKVNELIRVDNEIKRDEEFNRRINEFIAEIEAVESLYPERLLSIEENLTKHLANYKRDTLENNRMYNINDYNIYADGINDVSSSIQNLLDVIPDGSTLLIPSVDLEYVFNSSLNLENRKNITIEGLGGLAKIKNGVDSNIATFNCVDSESIKFKNISVNVDRQNQNSDLYPRYVNQGFYIVNSNNVTLENVEMLNSTRELKILDCTNVYIDGLYIDDVLIDGISLDNCVGGIVRNVSIKNVLDSKYVSSANGVEVEDGTRNMKFYNIYCDNIRSTGLKIQTHMGVEIACNNILIDGLEVNNSGYAFHTNNWNYDIKVKNMKGKNLSENVIKLYEVTDIELDGFNLHGAKGIMNTRVDDIIFRNGTLDIENANQNSAGVFIQARHVNILFENVNIISNQHSFVTLEAFESLENVVVRNCNLESRSNSAVWISGVWDKLKFENCNIKIPTGTRRVILDSAEGVEFNNCDIISKSSMGISIREGCKNISINGGNIVSLNDCINIGVQRDSNVDFRNIKITNVNIESNVNGITLRSLLESNIENLIVSNCMFDNDMAINFLDSENIDTITFIGNIGKDSKFKNEYLGVNMVDIGNNFLT